MRARLTAVFGVILGCADPVIYGSADQGDPPAELQTPELSFVPALLSLESAPAARHFVEVEITAPDVLTIEGARWEGDETWDVQLAAPSLPLRLSSKARLQLDVRTGRSEEGGTLVLWGGDRDLGRLPVERWESPSLSLSPERLQGVGVVGTRLRLPLELRRRAEAPARVEWRVVADEALDVDLPSSLEASSTERRKVTVDVRAERAGDWTLRVAALDPERTAWATAALHFESADAWQLEVHAEPDGSSSWLTDLRRFEASAGEAIGASDRRSQSLSGPAEQSAELALRYVEDCAFAPSGLLSSLFGATLSTLVPGSAEWQEVVESVCVSRGPLALRWTLRQGEHETEGEVRLEQRGDRVVLGTWDGRARRLEVAP